ncbi:unnamed protein product [Phaedon cochleariae]|uniref:CRAL-TRIO domain-containing protein n=1 Tax=Phaedon cochleariae TaxID=80249 RepID=A0A9P0DIE4_PHACE|nr:unnamed protein product [Phaedon cochleariae]
MPVERTEPTSPLTDEQQKDCILRLRQMLKTFSDEKHLKNICTQDSYLKRYLYGTHFNVEEAFKKMVAGIELLVEHPDWYKKEGPKDQELLDLDVRVVLPDCDKEGRPIYVIKSENIDVNKVSMYDVIALDDIWLEAILNGNPKLAEKGLCVIMDMHNTPWKIMKWLRPENVNISSRKTESLPFKDVKVHIVNNTFFMNTIIKMVWPFLPEKIKKMVIFHFNSFDVLYDHIDQKVLPLEYGGFKKIVYADLYKQLRDRNDEIIESFNMYRNVEKY